MPVLVHVISANYCLHGEQPCASAVGLGDMAKNVITMQVFDQSVIAIYVKSLLLSSLKANVQSWVKVEETRQFIVV